MLGRKIQHPASTRFDDGDDDYMPPSKRFKSVDNTDDEDIEVRSECDIRSPVKNGDEIGDSDEEDGFEDFQPILQKPTELESALPLVDADKQAIAEYEAMRVAGLDPSEDLRGRLGKRNWTKGKSSIYVDAFNLALETVLGDEKHLFDEREMAVFDNWRDLDYEAQYL